MFIGKTIILPTLTSLYGILQNHNNVIPPLPRTICGDRIILKHYMHRDTNVVRAWKSKTFLDWWYEDFRFSSAKNFIAAIDYSVNDDHIKIEYMNQNDNNYSNNMNHKCYPFLDKYSSKKMNHAMIEYIKNVAKEHNIKKVIIDVHYNLDIFNQYYKPENFVITERKCKDNPYWLEAELDIL